MYGFEIFGEYCFFVVLIFLDFKGSDGEGYGGIFCEIYDVVNICIYIFLE